MREFRWSRTQKLHQPDPSSPSGFTSTLTLRISFSASSQDQELISIQNIRAIKEAGQFGLVGAPSNHPSSIHPSIHPSMFSSMIVIQAVIYNLTSAPPHTWFLLSLTIQPHVKPII
ncbi:hypothetical protein GOODEAATRI_026625 [Goodea atripinnis]|uniref:Uncharacterized protein n=1 Tax=Goodea atripinnis TaxID=208336 RepID=A0ABV0PHL7_9TELE